jgi:hypothetical protein
MPGQLKMANFREEGHYYLLEPLMWGFMVPGVSGLKLSGPIPKPLSSSPFWGRHVIPKRNPFCQKDECPWPPCTCPTCTGKSPRPSCMKSSVLQTYAVLLCLLHMITHCSLDHAYINCQPAGNSTLMWLMESQSISCGFKGIPQKNLMWETSPLRTEQIYR